MEYIVTARKWRPLRFDEVIGQEHVTQTLKNAVRMNRIHHAYLFSGPRGVGKTTTARILARVVNCQNPIDAEPCNKCESCISILEGRSLDVIEIDGASNNSVDDVRTLRENAKYPPISGKYKIYIIDEVHMLSTSAFNALLKILEEPPSHLIFVFATTEPHKVLPTILSRCQRFEFHRMEINTIIEQISKIARSEGITIDDMSLYTLAKKADGSMRDAQSIFDQFVASAGKTIQYEKVKELLHIIDNEYYFKVSDAFQTGNSSLAFEITEELTRNGYDYSEFLSGLLEHFRNIYFFKIVSKPEQLNLPKSIFDKYVDTARNFNEKDLIRIMNLISSVEQQIKFATLPRIRVELLLLQIIEMPTVVEINELIQELRELKSTTISTNLPERTEKPKQDSNTSIESNEMKSWDKFLEKYNTKFNGLKGFFTSNLLDVEFKNKQIIIIAKNDFVFENVNSKKRALKIAVKEFFGSDYDIEIIQSEKAHSKVKTYSSEHSKAQSEAKTDQSSQNNYSEVEQTIINLFGAREIPLP